MAHRPATGRWQGTRDHARSPRQRGDRQRQRRDRGEDDQETLPAGMSPLDLERVDGVPIVHVNEDIDAANATITQQRLAETLGPDASSLVVDLSETRYVDSAGIDMLLRLSDRLDHRRARLILVIPDTS